MSTTPTKGKNGGICGHPDCSNPNARHFNIVTQKCYCASCAHRINAYTHVDAVESIGRDICEPVLTTIPFTADDLVALGAIGFKPHYFGSRILFAVRNVGWYNDRAADRAVVMRFPEGLCVAFTGIDDSVVVADVAELERYLEQVKQREL